MSSPFFVWIYGEKWLSLWPAGPVWGDQNRATLYQNLGQLQPHLNRYPEFYNRNRAHLGLSYARAYSLSGLLEGVNQMWKEVAA